MRTLSRNFLLLVLLASTVWSADTVSKLRLTPELAISGRRIQALSWSEDGSRLAFVVSEPPKGSEHSSHIWVYGSATGELRQFTNSSKAESQPRWSPDGKRLAFLSNREEEQQIFLMPADGGEAKRLTEGKRSIKSFEWSPDGKQIAFLAPAAKTEEEEKKEKDKNDAHSVDKDDKHTQLWLVEVESGKTRSLVTGPWEFAEVQWTHAGDRLLVVATDHPESDQETNRIYWVAPADGKMQEALAPRGPFANLRISPDDKAIAYVGSRVDGPAPHDLFLAPIAGNTASNLTSTSLDRPVEEFAWSDNGGLLALASIGFRNQFYRVTSQGQSSPFLTPDKAVRTFALSHSGQLAFVGETSTQLPEVWLQAAKGNAPRVISRFNDASAPWELATPEFVRYKSFDGQEIEGALLKPLHSEAKSKWPAVLLIHGGPTGNWTDTFDSWGQLLANAGYAVFYPNVRGSTGYGYDFMVKNRADWGGGDFKDVMAAADYLVASGVADPERLGIAGWSYGGYMSEWAITQTHRFKAAVSGAGLADLAAEYGTEEHPSYDEWFYGLPYENLAGFEKSSPITYVKNARTPTLILQGEADTIDPLGQSQQLYRGLKRYGVATELVVYPRENHGFKEEKHLLDRLNRIVAWFDKYLKP
ncbi:MAG: S9 family peptidase [Acidobacteria bacterium]|nr:S9 family peptidase [Acidobacteriota bacterium]